MKQSSMMLIFLNAVAALHSSASLAADPSHGQQLAQRWCASCHLVSSDQQRTTTDAPPFAVIPNQPGFEAASLALFLLDPHPKMPNMSLTRTEATDLAAYIASLAK